MAQTIQRGPVTGTAMNRRKRKAPFFVEFYRSAIGKKYAMAISGVILMGFVLAHMIGNLKMYLGPAELDRYGEFLRELLVPLLPRTVTLWLIRSVLIVAFAVHIHAAYALTMMNRRARPVRYQTPRDYIAANFASRTMRWTGVIVLAFLAFHLADFTWGVKGIRGGGDNWHRGAPYENLVASFNRPVVAILYIVANLALGFHLWHGGWSLFQSLGVNNPRFNHWRRWFASGFAGIIVVANVSFPIAVLADIVKV
jgi:succinate dehydrogenase / fumarate reductase cytochrome b subunit